MSDEDRRKYLQAMLGSRDLVAWLCPACQVVSSGKKVPRGKGKVICERCAQIQDAADNVMATWSSLADTAMVLKLEDALLSYSAPPDGCLSIYLPNYKMRVEFM